MLYVVDHTPTDEKGLWARWYAPIIAFMTDEEAAAMFEEVQHPIFTTMKTNNGDVAMGEALAIMFSFLTSDHTRRYWLEHEQEHGELLQTFLDELVKQGIAQAVKLDRFDKILQTKGLLSLPKVMRPLSKNRNAEAGIATAKGDSVTWIVNTFMDGKISPTTLRLLMTLLSRTEKVHDMGVFISWEDYADYIGIEKNESSLKRIRAQMLEDAEILSSARYESRERNGRVVKVPLFGGLSFDETRKQRGGLYWIWSPVVFKSLEELAPVDVPRELYKASTKSSAIPLGLAICSNYRMNEGKDRLEKMTVKSLLKHTPTIPTIEELQKAGDRRSAKQKIVIPFWHTLDEMGDWLVYLVYDRDGREVENPLDLSYEDFIDCYIMIDYSDFPTHEERTKNRKKHAKGSVKSRKRVGEKSQKGR